MNFAEGDSMIDQIGHGHEKIDPNDSDTLPHLGTRPPSSIPLSEIRLLCPLLYTLQLNGSPLCKNRHGLMARREIT